MYDIKKGDIIHAVRCNSEGGWNWSQSFSVTAVTPNWVAAIPVDEGIQHQTSHWAGWYGGKVEGGGVSFGTSIAIHKDEIDTDFAFIF
jgi:hypothetical protein